MPYKSDAQRKFFHTDTAKAAGITGKEVKEFDQASKGKELPEHVKKMAEGGEVNKKATEDAATKNELYTLTGQKEDAEPSDQDKESYTLTGHMANGGTTAGNPSDLDPSVKDASVSDFLLPYLLGPSTMKAGAELPSALEGLGETGEVSLGKAGPEGSDLASKLTRYSKGVMGKGTPNEVTIESVKGAPEDIAKLGYGPDPASIPSHILDAHGIPSEAPTTVPESQNPTAPFAQDLRELWGNAAKEQSGTPITMRAPYQRPDMVRPEKMAEGGFPHVTFMEDQTPAEVKKTVHMAEGGEVPHDKKLNSIYKAMGIKKYADGGDVDASQLPSSGTPAPSPSDPTYWDQIKAMLSKVGNSPAGTIAGMAMNPVSGIANAVEGAAPAIASAEGPAVAKVANVMTGGATPPMAPAAPIAPPPAAMPPAMPPMSPPPVGGASSVPGTSTSVGMPNIGQMFNQDTSKLTEGSNPEDRQALVDKLQSQQHGLGAMVAQALAGIGDAYSAKGGKETHALGNIFSMQKDQRTEALANFDKARQDRVQKLALQTQMGDNALKQAAAADAYGVDEHLNKILGAPKGTMKKDLPNYMGIMSAGIAAKEKDEDLYMKAHAQAGADVDNAIKNSSVFGFKPSPEQIQARGNQLANKYQAQAKGLYHSATNPQTGHKVESYDGGQSWNDAGPK